MKSSIHTVSHTLIPLVVLMALVLFTINASKLAQHYQARAVAAPRDVVPQIPPGSYNDLLNRLFTNSGR